MEIRTMIFDIGGVLANFNLEPFFKFITSKGGSIEKDKTFFLKYKPIVDMGIKNIDEYWTEYIHFMGINSSVEELKKVSRETVRITNGMENLLKIFYNKGINLIIASNTDKETFKEFSKNFNKKLFAEFYVSYEIGMLKPNKDFFLKIIHEQNLDPEKTLFIDDSEENIESAKNLNIQTHLFTDLNAFYYFIKKNNIVIFK